MLALQKVALRNAPLELGSLQERVQFLADGRGKVSHDKHLSSTTERFRTKMAGEVNRRLNVAVLVSGPSKDEHDAQLHQALLIEKQLAKLANVTILGKPFLQLPRLS